MNQQKNKTEKQIELEIRKHLEFNFNAYIIKTHGSAFTKPGIPDLICCIGGWFLAIEVKKHDGVVSREQEIQINNIIKSEGHAIVARSLREVLDYINKNL